MEKPKNKSFFYSLIGLAFAASAPSHSSHNMTHGTTEMVDSTLKQAVITREGKLEKYGGADKILGDKLKNVGDTIAGVEESPCSKFVGFAEKYCLAGLGGKSKTCSMKNARGLMDTYTVTIDETDFLPRVAKTSGIWEYGKRKIAGSFDTYGVLSIKPKNSGVGIVGSSGRDPHSIHIKIGVDIEKEMTLVHNLNNFNPHHIEMTVRKHDGTDRYYFGYGAWVRSVIKVENKPGEMPVMKLYHSLRWGYTGHGWLEDNAPHQGAAHSRWYAQERHPDKTC